MLQYREELLSRRLDNVYQTQTQELSLSALHTLTHTVIWLCKCNSIASPHNKLCLWTQKTRMCSRWIVVTPIIYNAVYTCSFWSDLAVCSWWGKTNLNGIPWPYSFNWTMLYRKLQTYKLISRAFMCVLRNKYKALVTHYQCLWVGSFLHNIVQL